MTAPEASQDQRALIKHALLKIDELQGKLRAYEMERHEPVAIIGMGCRIPGGANNPDAFWRLLRDGQDAVGEVPSDRWDIDAYYDPDPDAPGKMSTRYGAFLEHIDEFDPQFFGIAPREAVSMDPQQRLVLEVAWEALEHANIPADRLYGSTTGVFIGIISQDYSQRLLTDAGINQIDAYAGTGASLGMAAGRLSYCLGLTGPSLSVDTACSSSLVTLHLACDSLRRRECTLALTGGVNLMIEPALSINFSKARMLAPDGRCKTFDQAADGYVRGEGCGVLVLKRLSDAQQDGDHVLAVIRGSAVNQDGPSGGLTVPNGHSQEYVIRQALANARVSADAISYIEAHGTGTALGDPIELGALDRVFGGSHSSASPLQLGSVKTNIGHLEAAAGVAGVIKLVLALQHQCLPPHLHCRELTSRFPWAGKSLQVVRAARPWPRSEKPRIAGVSSFGFSGTNAHVVIEEAPQAAGIAPAVRPTDEADQPHLLTLSAQSNDALLAAARRYRDYLHHYPEITPQELCATAATGRAHLQHRLSAVASTVTEFAESLDDFAQGKASSRIASGRIDGDAPPPLAFLFTGQGSQHPGMGRQLYRTQPVFRDAINHCDEILRSQHDIPLIDLMFHAEAGRLSQTGCTQPALFCLEYALSELWRSLGVQPDAMLGHSVGEYVAACVAGVFSLADGIRLIAARARLMQALPSGGGMAAIFAPESQVSHALTGIGEQVSIAALNGPEHVVVSGNETLLDQLLAAMRDRNITYRKLNVSHAFHSPLMEPMLAEFARVAHNVTFHPPTVPLVSNLTGAIVQDEIARAEYWVKHIRQAVRFADGMATLRHLGCRIFLEIGPDPILLAMARDCSQDGSILVPSLRRADETRFVRSIGDLYVHGVPIDWDAAYKGTPSRALTLPTYPFQRKRYWIPAHAPHHGNSSAPDRAPHLNDADSLLRYFSTSADLTAEEKKLLPKFIELLLRHRSAPSEPDLQSVCYRLAWQPKSRTTQTDPAITHVKPGQGTWFVMAGDDPSDLALRIREAGRRCAQIECPASERACQGLLERLKAEGPIDGIIYLWPSDHRLNQSSCRSAEARLMHVVRLMRTLARNGVATRLWLVTQGATSAGRTHIASPFPALLWGFGRSLFLEHSQSKGGLIDISAVPGAGELAALVQDLLDPDGEDGIALRGTERYVARMEPARPIPPKPAVFRQDGAYLITGGLGALGLHVAQLLADNGAGALALMSRRPPSDRAQAAVNAMRKHGTSILIVHGDCTDETSVQTAMQQIRHSGFALKGVVHAAGIMTPQPVLDLEPGSLHDVLAPKVDGAWVLHRLTQDSELDFFVCFSSIASVLGTAFRAHYGAANAFLDGLAEYRQALGLPVLTVNWGPWQGGGLADGEAGRRTADSGFKPMPAKVATHLLGQLLTSGEARMIVVDADWPRVKSLYEVRGRQPLLQHLDLPPRQTQAATSSAVVDSLHKAAVSDRLQLLTAFLQAQVSAVLYFDADSTPDPRQGFFDLGLDSLTAVEFKGRVETQLGCSLPPSIVFDHPNIAALAAFLLETMFPAEQRADVEAGDALTPVATARATQPRTDVSELSDSQIAALIDGELATLVGGK